MSTDINKKLCAAIIKDYRLNDDQTESAFLVLQSMFGSNVDSSVTESQLAYQEIEKYRKTSTEDRLPEMSRPGTPEGFEPDKLLATGVGICYNHRRVGNGRKLSDDRV